MGKLKFAKPLEDNRMTAAMSLGHRRRTGHSLDAHLESEDGEMWQVVRDCCGE